MTAEEFESTVGTRGPRARGRAGGPALPFQIESARSADLPAIVALLRAAELPHDDIAPHLAHFLVARDERDTVIGAVGAEAHAPEALLRSLVVAPENRGTGVAGALLRELETIAAAWGVQRWWLLTTTAETFFAARGFRVTSREQAPATMRATGQFSGGCCRSAACMTRARAAIAS